MGATCVLPSVAPLTGRAVFSSQYHNFYNITQYFKIAGFCIYLPIYFFSKNNFRMETYIWPTLQKLKSCKNDKEEMLST